MENTLRLSIKLLSRSGEVLNCVHCFAGQVTVLRAIQDHDLLPYQHALAGIPGAERFVLELTGGGIEESTYQPDQQVLIGFGERLPPGKTVAQIFADLQISKPALTGLLHSFGLAEKADSASETLTACESRRIQLLRASFEPARVWVLCDPFDPLGAEWRERLAEFLITQTRDKKLVTVVPRLTFRPQAWIGNDLVARMQVGDSVQKTIGFAGKPDELNRLIAEIRSEKGNATANTPATTPPTTTTPHAFDQQKSPLKDWETDDDRRVQTASPAAVPAVNSGARELLKQFVLGLSLVFTTVIAVKYFDEPTSAPVVQIPVVEAPPPIVQPPPEIVQQPLALLPPIAVVETPAVKPPDPKYVLDQYPAQVREAIIASMQGSPHAHDAVTENATENSAESSPASTPPPQPELPADVRKLLGNLSSGEPGQQEPTEQSEGPDQQRQVSQRFMEAINRAIEARQQE
jgi:hypothetical protein